MYNEYIETHLRNCKMKTVLNLATFDKMSFMDDISSEWAVAYAYCENNNLMSWLFNNRWDNTLEKAYKELPMIYGKLTVACGDWACKL